MKKILRKKILSLVLVLAILMSQIPNFELTAKAAGLTATSNLPTDSGFVLSGDTIYQVNSDITITGSAGQSALSVAHNTTAVIYIAKGATLTVTGGIGDSGNGGAAAIDVPADATLIVTGMGTLNATGGNGSDAQSGKNGGGSLIVDSGWSGGAGGSGGYGAGGGGAAIGGAGGTGGVSGSGGAVVTSDNYSTVGTARNGGSGGTGGNGTASGTVYLLSSLTVTAAAGHGGSTGTDGTGKPDYEQTLDSGYVYSGGGGAGGGAGKIALSIGGGGAGGAGGGGGGAGGYAGDESAGAALDGAGGSGGNGGAYSSADTQGYTGGTGGASGSQGSVGISGAVYARTSVNFKLTTDITPQTSFTPPEAVQYTVTLSNSPSADGSAAVSYGELMPSVTPPTRSGYLFKGYYDAAGGGGTQYYNLDGTLTVDKSQPWTSTGGITLYADWADNRYSLNTVTSDTKNGIKVDVNFNPINPVAAGTAVTATVSISGTPLLSATHIITLKSADLGTDFGGTFSKTVTAGTAVSDTSNTYTFTMPAKAISDITVTQSVTPTPTGGFTAQAALPTVPGSTLSNGYIYTLSGSTTIQAASGQNGLNIAPGATVVLYIPANVTLTVRGGNGTARQGGGAGIYVPGSSTLIVSGAGSLTATGGSGGGATSGGSAGNGYLSKSGDGSFYGGNGGGGGVGAGGGGAGIGGNGGNGGNGGSGGSFGSSVACFHPSGRKTGASGSGGGTGGSGAAAGSFYVLGGVSLSLTGGSTGGSAGGGNGGTSVNDSGSGWNNYYTASGGGSGAGGGAGGNGASFGAGGGGGGGGGGGAAGSTYTDSDRWYYYVGGNGYGGSSSGGNGSPGSNGPDSTGMYFGSSGGSGGGQGSGGTAGTVTKIADTAANQSATYPVVAQYTLTLDNQGADSATKGTGSVTAVYGLNLTTIVAPVRTGYTLNGYYTGQNGAGTKVYNADGTPISLWTGTGNMLLYASWTRNFYDLPKCESVTLNGVTASVMYSANAADMQNGKYGYGTAVTATVYFDGKSLNNAVHKVGLSGTAPLSGTDALGKSIAVQGGTSYANQAVAQCTITIPGYDSAMSLVHKLSIPLSLYNLQTAYNGSPIAYSLGGEIPGITGTVITYTGIDGTAYSASAAAPIHAGSYNVHMEFTTDTAKGYEALAPVDRTLTINPKVLAWSASGLTAQDKDYDGSSLATLSGTLSATGTIGSDAAALASYTLNTDLTAYFDNPLPGLAKTVNVDTSHLALTGANSADYALPSAGPALIAKIVGINPTVVVVISTPASQQYDGTAKPVDGIAKFFGTAWMLLNGTNDANVGYTYYTDAECTSLTTMATSGAAKNGGAPVNAGNYYVKAIYTPSAGQEMYQTTVSNAVPYGISQQPITAMLEWTDGEPLYTYSGTAHTPGVTAYSDSSRTTTLTPGVDYTVSYNNNVNSGSAQAVVKFIGNYNGGGSPVLTKNFTIDRAAYDMTEVGFETATTELLYDKASHSMAVNPLLSFFSANNKAGNVNIGVDDVTVAYRYACASNGYNSELPPSHAGVYTVTATYTSTNQNYNFNNSRNTIDEKATLTIKQVTPNIIVSPTAGSVTTGNKLSLSSLSEGYVFGLNEQISGTFAWSGPDTIMGAIGVPANYEVTFTPSSSSLTDYTATNCTLAVTPIANTYALSLASTTGNFGAVDYKAAGNTVTYAITNNSTTVLPNFDVTLGGTNASMFTLDKSGIPATLAIGGTATFKVTSLTSTAGTFSATITASGDKNANDGGGTLSKMVPIQQIVNDKNIILKAPIDEAAVKEAFGDGAIFTPGTPPKITLTGDTKLPGTIDVQTDVTIDLNGHTVTAPDGQPTIKVTENGVDITLIGKGGLVGGKGTSGTTGSDGAAAIDFGSTTGGTIVVDTGVTVSGGKGGDGTGGAGGNGGQGIAGSDVKATVNGTVKGGANGSRSTTGGNGGSKSTGGGSTTDGNSGSGSTIGGNGGSVLPQVIHSLTLDTKTYTMPLKSSYEIGIKLTNTTGMTVRVYSSTKGVASITKLKNGNYKINGLKTGLTYIMFDVYDENGELIRQAHASVLLIVKNGVKPNGNSWRQTAIF